MPWPTGKGFAEKHNQKLKGAAAQKAADMATAMVREGTPEGIAIATANKHGNAMQKKTRTRRQRTLYDHAGSSK